MLTPAQFAIALREHGKPATWTQGKEPHATAAIKAIIQSTSKSTEVLANAFGVTGFSIQVAADALPVAPERFDIFVDAANHRYVIDSVVPHTTRGTGLPVSFTCYSKGK